MFGERLSSLSSLSLSLSIRSGCNTKEPMAENKSDSEPVKQHIRVRSRDLCTNWHMHCTAAMQDLCNLFMTRYLLTRDQSD